MSDSNEYGPLQGLIGTWTGNTGRDIAPEPDGTEDSPYYETIVFEPIGDVENAEEQCLMALHYRQIVRRKSNDQVFHDQTGYWMWDASQKVVMQSIVIPRGVSLLAGGGYDETDANNVVLTVAASIADDADWGIVQSPFMQNKAKTLAYQLGFTVSGDKLKYSQNMLLDIYGREFDHTDENVLTRV